MDFPVTTNLGNMIAARPSDHPWLIEVTPDHGQGGGERVFSYGDLRSLAAAVGRHLQARELPPPVQAECRVLGGVGGRAGGLQGGRPDPWMTELMPLSAHGESLRRGIRPPVNRSRRHRLVR